MRLDERRDQDSGAQLADQTIDRLQRTHALGKLVGDAPAFRAAIARIPVIARADATVLLGGETGTGKELVARAIHYLSERRRGSFTAVNCGAPDGASGQARYAAPRPQMICGQGHMAAGYERRCMSRCMPRRLTRRNK